MDKIQDDEHRDMDKI